MVRSFARLVLIVFALLCVVVSVARSQVYQSQVLYSPQTVTSPNPTGSANLCTFSVPGGWNGVASLRGSSSPTGPWSVIASLNTTGNIPVPLSSPIPAYLDVLGTINYGNPTVYLYCYNSNGSGSASPSPGTTSTPIPLTWTSNANWGATPAPQYYGMESITGNALAFASNQSVVLQPGRLIDFRGWLQGNSGGQYMYMGLARTDGLGGIFAGVHDFEAPGQMAMTTFGFQSGGVSMFTNPSGSISANNVIAYANDVDPPQPCEVYAYETVMSSVSVGAHCGGIYYQYLLYGYFDGLDDNLLTPAVAFRNPSGGSVSGPTASMRIYGPTMIVQDGYTELPFAPGVPSVASVIPTPNPTGSPTTPTVLGECLATQSTSYQCNLSNGAPANGSTVIVVQPEQSTPNGTCSTIVQFPYDSNNVNVSLVSGGCASYSTLSQIDAAYAYTVSGSPRSTYHCSIAGDAWGSQECLVLNVAGLASGVSAQNVAAAGSVALTGGQSGDLLLWVPYSSFGQGSNPLNVTCTNTTNVSTPYDDRGPTTGDPASVIYQATATGTAACSAQLTFGTESIQGLAILVDVH